MPTASLANMMIFGRSMKTTNFVFAGERQTYWGLYYGWGVLVGVLLAQLHS